jgi:Kef-type K+ transport system membrane component KefB
MGRSQPFRPDNPHSREGGLELRLKDAIRYSPRGILLACVSFGYTLGLAASIVRQLLHMSWIDGVLMGPCRAQPVRR